MAAASWTETQDPRGVSTREFRIERKGRRDITGAVWLPADAAPGRPLVLFGHGASGDRYQAPIPYLARRFASEASYSCLSLDGPVHGLRQVGPGGRAALGVELQRPEAMDDMVEDWTLAISTAQDLGEIGSGPLAYFGLSMGSIFGIPLLATRDDVTAAVIGLLGTTGAAAAMRSRLLDDASKIRHPLVFLMQLEDELFPRDGYLELFDALDAEDKRIHANPGLHPEIPAEEVDGAFEFLCAHLEGRAQRRIVNPLAE